MRRFKQVVLIVMLLIVALFILTFILENQTKVTISFISFATPEIPLAVLVVVAFVLGLIVALIVNYLVLINVRLQLTMTKKQLANCKQELTNQRTTPLQLK